MPGMPDLDARIFVAGHRGLVGSAIVRALARAGYTNLLFRTRAELQLTDGVAVRNFFRDQRPDYVFLCAAKVGGIAANNRFPVDFITSNLAIQSNVIAGAHEVGVGRLLFLGSSCIYPKHAPQPIPESALMTGELEPTNRAYAVAKIAGIEMCAAFNRQHGLGYLAAMPTNLYGPGDNYDLETSHVIPALLRKFLDAVRDNASHVVVWGSGTPRREFLHADDLAQACLLLMNLPEHKSRSLASNSEQFPLINIGFGEDLSIADLATLIAELTGFHGSIVFDPSKPDGTPRKLIDSTRMRSLGWTPQISLREGLSSLIAQLQSEASLVQRTSV